MTGPMARVLLGCLIQCLCFGIRCHCTAGSAHRLALALDPVRIVHNAVKDRVGEGWVANVVMPGLRRKLGRDHRREVDEDCTPPALKKSGLNDWFPKPAFLRHSLVWDKGSGSGRVMGGALYACSKTVVRRSQDRAR